MLKLRWLQVNKFRSVKPGTRLDFHTGYNVLLGQNGTGKTTLLKLVAAATSLDFSKFKDIEFDLILELASSDASATISVRNEQRPSLLPFSLGELPQVQLGLLSSNRGLNPPNFSATVKLTSEKLLPQLTISTEGARGSVHTKKEQSVSSTDFDVSLAYHAVWVSCILGLEEWSQRTNTTLQKLRPYIMLFEPSNAVHFDESLDYFNNLGSPRCKLTRNTNGDVRLEDPIAPVKIPTEMRQTLISLAQEQWDKDHYIIKDSQLPFLEQTTQFLDFKSAETIIEIQETDNREDNTALMVLGTQRFFFHHQGGWKITESHLSYGQKRMLAFMHYLAATESIAIADELVNGLHHRWIRACIEKLGERQVFLTSQNPLLLDYLTFDTPEEVRSRFVLCSWEKESNQMVWENMSQEAAEDFFSSYKVGFQQVGELLQSKGLW